jgi:hypothetical protein
MTVDDILALPHDQIDKKSTWDHLDGLIGGLPDLQAQLKEWDRILRHAESIGIPTGHPHFRLGTVRLLVDADETAGLDHLLRAHESDQKFAPERVHTMGAYRLLSFAKDLLADMRCKRNSKKEWLRRQLDPPYRRVLVNTLFDIYDQTAQRTSLICLSIRTLRFLR